MKEALDFARSREPIDHWKFQKEHAEGEDSSSVENKSLLVAC